MEILSKIYLLYSKNKYLFLIQSISNDNKHKEEKYCFGSCEIDIQELGGTTLQITVIIDES